MLDRQFAAGSRVIAVAITRRRRTDAALAPTTSAASSSPASSPSSTGQRRTRPAALARLRALDVEVKVITGDNERVARKVCADLGLDVRGTLTGTELDRLDDERARGRAYRRRRSSPASRLSRSRD